jgi:transposase InsO family protein
MLRWQGCRYTVIALSGTTVHLAPGPGEQAAPAVVLLPALAAAADFEVLGRAGAAASRGPMPNWSRMEGISEQSAQDAYAWERHVVEVDTGLPLDPLEGARPRPGYDPACFTLIERYRTKAAELNAVLDWRISWQTVQRKRLSYLEQGVWGLVDKRRTRGRSMYGRTDPQVVDLLLELVRRQQTKQIDITADKLFTDLRRAVRHRLGKQARVPANPTLYKLLARLGYDARNLGNPNRGRRGRPGRPPTPFSATTATAPGELVQIDSTALDVKILGDDGQPAQVELTAAIDVHTRSIIAAIVRTKTLRGARSRRGRRALVVAGGRTGRATKAVDASLLLALALVPAPMRPGYHPQAAASNSDLPYEELVEVDERFAAAAARPVIVPEVIVIDHGSVFATQTFTDACAYMGISVRPARKRTPTDKAIVERTFNSIKSLFSQHVNTYTGRHFNRRAADVDATQLWTLQELDDLLQQWIAMGWQNRPHDELRDPRNPSRAPLTPNQMYAAGVQAAGYLPIPLGREDYLQLLPTAWVGVSDEGIRFRNRTYENRSGGLEPYRNTPSGLRGKHKDRWELRYNPYTPEQVWLHDHTLQGEQAWFEASFTRQHLINAKWTEYMWDVAAAELLERGGDRKDQDATAQVLAELLERAGRGPDEPGTVDSPDGYGPAFPGFTPQPFDPYADAPPVDLDSLDPLSALADDDSLYAPQPLPAEHDPARRSEQVAPSSLIPSDLAPAGPGAPGGVAGTVHDGFPDSYWSGLPSLEELGAPGETEDDYTAWFPVAGPEAAAAEHADFEPADDPIEPDTEN